MDDPGSADFGGVNNRESLLWGNGTTMMGDMAA